MESEDAGYRLLRVETCAKMRGKFMDFHRGHLAHLQCDIGSGAYHTVADFLKFLFDGLKYNLNESASVKALSKYGALCEGDILDNSGLTDLEY